MGRLTAHLSFTAAWVVDVTNSKLKTGIKNLFINTLRTLRFLIKASKTK
jgi:hypothetical protein